MPSESGKKRLRLAYVRFTSCCGCQLTLLNCEGHLEALGEAVDLVAFAMASSRRDDRGPLDVALVEGSVSSPDELDRLLELRRRSDFLVAVGACALTGGVNTLGGPDRSSLCRIVYGETARKKTTFPPQPLCRFVAVDLELAGCPPERHETLQVLGALGRGGLAALPEYAVCMECRRRENLCLLLEGKQPCLGPVTRAGCRAHCPSFGVICEGCRGLVAEANRGEEFRLLMELGFSEREVRSRMERFTGVFREDD
jgi:coenzyme F420-reducing hydrogenase gamma subunit